MPISHRSKVLGVRRKKRLARRGFRWVKRVLVFLLFLLILWLLLWSPFVRVKNVSVVGAISGVKDQVKEKVSQLFSGRSFLLLPHNHVLWVWFARADVEKALMTSSGNIAAVSARIDFPSGLQVEVEQRKPLALWCFGASDERCFWIDKEGILFSDAAEVIGRSLALRIHAREGKTANLGDLVLEAEQVQFLSSFYEELRKENFEISDFYEGKTYYEGIRAYSRQRWNVIFLARGSPEELIRNLKLVVAKALSKKSSQLDYIDMRLGNKIFYKLKQ